MIILHHYPQSPVSEKVRVALGIKEAEWHSVIIPRLPPKPDVVALTGGYRRTPVLQIGADIYCDSLCILRALEHHCPHPSLFPDGATATAWGLSQWTDGPLFNLALAVVLGSEADRLPAEFAADRGRLYFGPRYDLQALQQRLPDLLSQLRAHLTTMETLLGEQRFMHGTRPGLLDALCYYLLWFVRGRCEAGAQVLAAYTQLDAWRQRVAALGHGRPSELDSQEAVEIAAASAPACASLVDPADPLDLPPDTPIAVVPAGDGGDPEVEGELVRLSVETVAIRRRDRRAGEVVVHFPRAGYEIRPV